ncbi:DNA repair nuclease/redox regulator APEX1 isoform X10 [Hydra vulgaris]|uniref:DNA repair nuclease/redox regulator APEX1 isoform X10 n=1 Tax=Hydra vulgaris TaxID=6087 RepID=UPI0032E9D02D
MLVIKSLFCSSKILGCSFYKTVFTIRSFSSFQFLSKTMGKRSIDSKVDKDAKKTKKNEILQEEDDKSTDSKVDKDARKTIKNIILQEKDNKSTDSKVDKDAKKTMKNEILQKEDEKSTDSKVDKDAKKTTKNEILQEEDEKSTDSKVDKDAKKTMKNEILQKEDEKSTDSKVDNDAKKTTKNDILQEEDEKSTDSKVDKDAKKTMKNEILQKEDEKSTDSKVDNDAKKTTKNEILQEEDEKSTDSKVDKDAKKTTKNKILQDEDEKSTDSKVDKDAKKTTKNEILQEEDKKSTDSNVDKDTKKIIKNEILQEEDEKKVTDLKDEKMETMPSDFESKTVTADGRTSTLKICSWNVAGLRAWVNKNGLNYVIEEDPDVLCLQETKCTENDLPGQVLQMKNGPKVTNVSNSGYYMYWCNAKKKGCSGVSLWCKLKPLKVTYGLGIKEHDSEGRLITAEFEKYYIITTYVPNSGQKLIRLDYRRIWNTDYKNYVGELKKKKPVIMCGDFNVAHTEIDIANPNSNKRNAGFTEEERSDFTALLEDGYIDTFRKLNPEKTGAYTFWTYMMNARSKNKGWRLDYFIVTKDIEDDICDSVIRSSVMGSDHCPIVLNLAI